MAPAPVPRFGLAPLASAAAAVAVVVALVFLPELAFESAVYGLRLWWDVVFPALLPFFVAAEVLMGLGVVHFMGVLLEPFMRPLFNVPGTGSFVLAMGLASGFPIGAILSSRLRREAALSKSEAERLISFTNTADPLFMSGAVAVGMFGDGRVALPIMAAHYLSSLTVGVVMRFHRGAGDTSPAVGGGHSGFLGARAVQALLEARERDGRPFGQLLGDAVRNSANTLMLIGGFIILSAVIIRILVHVGVVAVLAGWFSRLSGGALSPPLAESLIAGLFEITVGTQMASQAPGAVAERVAVAGAIIAWSGLSVHGQVASIAHGTDISLRPYVLARLLHGTLAALYTLVLWGPLGTASAAVAVPVAVTLDGPSGWAVFWPRAWAGLRLATAVLAVAAAGSVVLSRPRLPRALAFYVSGRRGR